MNRVKIFWGLITIFTAFLAVLVLVDSAGAQCGSCPADQQGPVTDTISVNVAAGETCEFTAHATAQNPTAAFVGANVSVPGHGTAHNQESEGCFDSCGGNVSCILSCQRNCTSFGVETDAVLEVTFESSGVYTASASATGTCNPDVQLFADCSGGDDEQLCMMPLNGDMNGGEHWVEVGDINWETVSGDGYAVIAGGDWIQQVIPMTYTTQTYWNYYAEPAAGYAGDEVQIQITHYGLTTTPYSVTVELPSSGFITLPLTGSVGIMLTGVSSPTRLSFFCLGYGDYCQFPDSELTNINMQWSPPEQFGTYYEPLYEPYGGAILDAGERFYQGIANDYQSVGNYALHISGTATAPITLGVRLDSCGLTGAGSGDNWYYHIPISPTGGYFDHYEQVVCDGYNRLEVKNLSSSQVFVDRVCLEEMAVCQPLGGCNLLNASFEAALELFGISIPVAWGVEDGTYQPPPTATITLDAGGYISQSTCIAPGDYQLIVTARGITESGGFGAQWLDPGGGDEETTIPMRVQVGAGAAWESVRLGDFDTYITNFHVSSQAYWHELRIEHGGAQHHLEIANVCLLKIEDTPADTNTCGVIRNSTFINTSEDPPEAEPWYVTANTVDFHDNYIEQAPNGAIAQNIISNTTALSYTLRVVARARRRSLARLLVSLDETEHQFEWNGTGEQVLTYTFESVTPWNVDVIELKNNSTGFWANRIDIFQVCLFPGDIPTDSETVSATYDCDEQCDFPAPNGCDTSLNNGNCDYYGKPASMLISFTDIPYLGTHIGRWFDWLKCHLECWFRKILDALRERVENITGIELPSLDDIRCWLISLPALLNNTFGHTADRIFNYLAFLGNDPARTFSYFFEWIAQRIVETTERWENRIAATSYAANQIADFILNLGDLFVEIVNTLFLPVGMVLSIMASVLYLAIIFVGALATPADSLELPAPESLFWCILEQLDWFIDNTAFYLVPAALIGFLAWRTYKWTLQRVRELQA